MAKKKTQSRIHELANTPMGDQPWYVKAIVWVGVPTAAAGYLLWFVVSVLNGRLDAISLAGAQNQKDMATLIQHFQQETNQAWLNFAILQQVCLNTASTQSERMACVTVNRRPQ